MIDAESPRTRRDAVRPIGERGAVVPLEETAGRLARVVPSGTRRVEPLG